MNPRFRGARGSAALFAAAGLCLAGEAPPLALPKNSPFLPPAGANTPAAAAAGENLEFAGVSSVGKRTDLIFHDKAAKKNHWVGLGETKEGIQVVSYDERREQAVIKHQGVQKTLPLRKGARTVASPAAPLPPGVLQPVSPAMPVAAAPALVFAPAQPVPDATTPPPAEPPAPDPLKPAGPPVPETQLRQETEARMLVSDLLEIGMAQRRAYEDAQRKAAEGTPPPAPPAEAPKP